MAGTSYNLSNLRLCAYLHASADRFSPKHISLIDLIRGVYIVFVLLYFSTQKMLTLSKEIGQRSYTKNMLQFLTLRKC